MTASAITSELVGNVIKGGMEVVQDLAYTDAPFCKGRFFGSGPVNLREMLLAFGLYLDADVVVVLQKLVYVRLKYVDLLFRPPELSKEPIECLSQGVPSS
jgi:hypothetical protein